MDITSGIFTAPKSGIYFFSFSGIGSDKSITWPQLFLNDDLIGTGNANTNSFDTPTFTLQSTLQLNAGDQISLKLNSVGDGYLVDTANHFTHFIGWLLQEDLSL